MEWHKWSAVLGSLVFPTAVVLVFALALWSDRTRALKMARKWGVPEPTDGQVDEVLRYRRVRLACYPVLYAVFGIWGPLAQNDQGGTTNGGMAVLPMFLCGAVIAEVLALHRGRGRRSRPVRIRLFALISRWGAVVYAALVLTTFALGLIDLQAQPHITPALLRAAREHGTGDQLGAPITVPFAGTAAVLVLVAFVLWTAQNRSVSSNDEIDRALRTRSARVALGLGIAMQISLLSLSTWRMAFVAGHSAQELIPTGPDTFGPDPAATAIRDWAQNTYDSVGSWTFLICIVATLTWIYAANPRTTTTTNLLSRTSRD
ncbi:hypothetical protein QFW96_09310 [Saccharopolyspora sp. TS4A08]|uniref:Uncharacterized protein n=1 Tax=Saccharopolyspora ipomoeae TaxID=3042027 RepID=A0ABT6PMD2_9PSEU|nr:hypothetical protein [Saccharopolyspora sp. TS4A08]MDI2028808.1 hypothetical protein [Saccharopolyspora sp. TS4A08]